MRTLRNLHRDENTATLETFMCMVKWETLATGVCVYVRVVRVLVMSVSCTHKTVVNHPLSVPEVGRYGLLLPTLGILYCDVVP
jgi:hypothetical protein